MPVAPPSGRAEAGYRSPWRRCEPVASGCPGRTKVIVPSPETEPVTSTADRPIGLDGFEPGRRAMDVERAASIRHIVGRQAIRHDVVVDDADAPPGAPASPAPVNVSSALRTVPSPMPVTSKLISVTAPCGPPMASSPALSGDCDAFGAEVNTVVSEPRQRQPRWSHQSRRPRLDRRPAPAVLALTEATSPRPVRAARLARS